MFYYRLRQIDLDGTTHFTDAHLVSVDITTNVQEKSTPTRMDLAQNYPNPFNPSTTIRFSLARSSSITLKVFNMLGEEVATLVDDAKQPGEYRAIWKANGMASGTYFYRLAVLPLAPGDLVLRTLEPGDPSSRSGGSAASFVATRKMTLTR